jgi:hypothetical protein
VEQHRGLKHAGGGEEIAVAAPEGFVVTQAGAARVDWGSMRAERPVGGSRRRARAGREDGFDERAVVRGVARLHRSDLLNRSKRRHSSAYVRGFVRLVCSAANSRPRLTA